MPVFSSIEVQSFRSLRGLKLDQLGQANVLFGVNDSGKTSVLEAILLLTNPMNPALWAQLAMLREPQPMRFRRLPRTDRVRWLFPAGKQADSVDKIEISGSFQLGRTLHRELSLFDEEHITFAAAYAHAAELRPVQPWRSADGSSSGEAMTNGAELVVNEHGGPDRKFTLWEDESIRVARDNSGRIPVQLVMAYQHWFGSSMSERFSRARLENTTDSLVELLKLLDDDIHGLELLQPEGEPTLYVQHATNGLVPLSVFGDGVRRALFLAEAVMGARGGLLLIDEIETGIHVNALTGVFRWLLRACQRYDVQLFVTTHSIDAIDAILKADETPEEDVVAYRLARENALTTAKRFSEKQLRWMREERGLDMRK